MSACPACGFNRDIHDPDAYVAQGSQLAAEIRRLPLLPSAPECDCDAAEALAPYHTLTCAITRWMGDEREVPL